MSVTQDTTLGIGDLARLTGVPVRTIRFYCDEGIIEARRSAGGHRRFDPAALDRLGLIRRLRGLGLGLPSITQVLTGARSVAEVIAAERAALDIELGALAWRRACLRAVEQAAPVERAARLELLAAAGDGRSVHEALVSFWRGLFVGPVPADTIGMFLEIAVPAPPADPTPEQVVAYAELVVQLEDRALWGKFRDRARAARDLISDEAALLVGLGEACELAMPLMLAGRPPGPGAALDRFVQAHASVRGTRDTPVFRRELRESTVLDRHPRVRRYWALVSELTGEPVTTGAAHIWLVDALEASAGR